MRSFLRLFHSFLNDLAVEVWIESDLSKLFHGKAEEQKKVQHREILVSKSLEGRQIMTPCDKMKLEE